MKITGKLYLFTILQVSFSLPFTVSNPDLDCFNDGQSPSPFIPASDDCLDLAQAFLKHPHAQTAIIFADRLVPHQYVALPFTHHIGSCWVTITIQGEPGYDISTWEDIGNVIHDTAMQCLVQIPPGGRGWGGLSDGGNNRWLLVLITGKIVKERGEIELFNTTSRIPPPFPLNGSDTASQFTEIA